MNLLRQGYTDEETETYLEELEEKNYVDVLRLEKNIGVSAGRKILIDRSKTPIVMTLDNDIYVTEGWVTPILKIFNENEDIGFIGIPRYKLNGELDGVGGRRIKIINNVVYTEEPKVEQNKPFIVVDDVCGAILFRQDVKSEFTFDPQFFMAFSDLDKGLQFLASKWKKVVCLGSRVIHDQVGQKDLNYIAERVNHPETSRAYARFRKKWGVRLSLKEHIIYKYVYPFIPSQV
ncbi:MAG: glycosyltransferase, partial [Candidatus Hodarchaeota archaeon]